MTQHRWQHRSSPQYNFVVETGRHVGQHAYNTNVLCHKQLCCLHLSNVTQQTALRGLIEQYTCFATAASGAVIVLCKGNTSAAPEWHWQICHRNLMTWQLNDSG